MFSVPSVRALLSILVAWTLLIPPSVVRAQPAGGPADTDLDGVADDVDMCPQVYGAPPSGCPPQVPTTTTTDPAPRSDRDGDGIYDDSDACPELAANTLDGCPDDSVPDTTTTTTDPTSTTDPTTTTTTEPADPNDEYDQFLRTLPNDFDIDYRYDAPARQRQRDRDPGLAAKQIRALRISGGTLMFAGAVSLIATLTTGLLQSKDAKDTLEAQRDDQDFDPGAPVDFEAREEALAKGEKGDKTAIVGGATSGAVFTLGAALLIGASALRRKTYGDSGGGSRSRGGGGNMSSKTRTNLTIYGAVSLIYGTAGLIGGGVLYTKDDAKKQKNGKILMALGGTAAGLGIAMLIPVLINRARKTARVDTGPMWVRAGGGASVRVRF